MWIKTDSNPANINSFQIHCERILIFLFCFKLEFVYRFKNWSLAGEQVHDLSQPMETSNVTLTDSCGQALQQQRLQYICQFKVGKFFGKLYLQIHPVYQRFQVLVLEKNIFTFFKVGTFSV